MIRLLPLAWSSLANRRLTVALTVLSIALSVALLVGVEKLRDGARQSYLTSIAGLDLIVAAPGSDVSTLLSTVFLVGDAPGGIDAELVDRLAAEPAVASAVPIALGDNHRGYRIVATTPERFAGSRRAAPLMLAAGAVFATRGEAVIGAEIARELGYSLGTRMVAAHGTGNDFSRAHADAPLTVKGVLEPSGTPADRAIFVDLSTFAYLHGEEGELAQVNAIFLTLRSPVAALGLQRSIATDERTPLAAVLPGVAFAKLWLIVGQGERALVAVSALVALTAFVGLIVAILSSLDARRREIAIFRAAGAGPADVGALFVVEALAVTVAAIVLGFALAYGGLALVAPWARETGGVSVSLTAPGPREGFYALAFLLAGTLAGLVPAFAAYRRALTDGLTQRL